MCLHSRSALATIGYVDFEAVQQHRYGGAPHGIRTVVMAGENGRSQTAKISGNIAVRALHLTIRLNWELGREIMEERSQDMQMDDNHWNTLQEILNAINSLDGVMDRIEAYMLGRGIENPESEIQALRKIAF